MLARRLRHREASLSHERERLRDADRRCRRQGRELADGVPDDVVRLDSSRLQRREHRKARGDERRLLHVGLDELL